MSPSGSHGMPQEFVRPLATMEWWIETAPLDLGVGEWTMAIDHSSIAEPMSTPDIVELDDIAPIVYRIPVLGYLKSVWALFWTAFRYPFTTTAIDLSTGRVVSEGPDDAEAAPSNHLVQPSV